MKVVTFLTPLHTNQTFILLCKAILLSPSFRMWYSFRPHFCRGCRTLLVYISPRPILFLITQPSSHMARTTTPQEPSVFQSQTTTATSATTDFPSGAPWRPGAIIAFLVALATRHYCVDPRRHFCHSCSWRILHSNSIPQRNFSLPLSPNATSLYLSPPTQPLSNHLPQRNLFIPISSNATSLQLSPTTHLSYISLLQRNLSQLILEYRRAPFTAAIYRLFIFYGKCQDENVY